MAQGEWDGETDTVKGNASLASNGGFDSLRWRWRMSTCKI